MRTSESAESLRKLWGPFSAMFKATANKFFQEKTQLKCYEDFLHAGQCQKSVKIN